MRRISRVLVLILTLCVLFSFGYAAMESCHDCHGDENCPICKIIALLSAVFGVICSPVLLVIGVYRPEKGNADVQERSERITLVRLKVKLLN